MTAMFLAALLTMLIAASPLNTEVFQMGRLLDPARMEMDTRGLCEPESFVAT